ncbi:MAG TPA: SAM-dependent methyltransferase [Myxococcales bacterium]|nr:SAM-dependent methyltransferase [Myxococcales bacterium]
MTTHDIVQKLWRLCDVLRDDGITYHQYVTELTWLLFLKMEQETRDVGQRRHFTVPEGYRWEDLVGKTGTEQHDFYKRLLLDLGTKAKGLVQEVYADASTSIRLPATLSKLVEEIDKLDWYAAKSEGLGDMYEGLLEKNAGEKKSGAGQYFTPRPLIDAMVALVKPEPGEVIQDPAAGTGGFLIAADRLMKAATDDYYALPDDLQAKMGREVFVGVELVPEAHRLLLMNLLLHDIRGVFHLGDSMASLGAGLPKADVILTNPPFGTKRGGGGPTRDDFTYPTSNKQLAFLQHIYRNLKPGGRAAVVLPDNVLFEEGVGTKIRADLMEKCDLHTILRLPTGIFYAQGVKTNVLFFTRGKTDEGNTKAVWVYDMRTNMPKFGKRTPFTREHFADFEKAFGKDARGKSRRKDQGEDGRFRKFTREDVAKRGDNLDITWLRDHDAHDHEDLGEPDEIAAEIIGHLQTAMAELEALSDLLESSEAAE